MTRKRAKTYSDLRAPFIFEIEDDDVISRHSVLLPKCKPLIEKKLKAPKNKLRKPVIPVRK